MRRPELIAALEVALLACIGGIGGGCGRGFGGGGAPIVVAAVEVSDAAVTTSSVAEMAGDGGAAEHACAFDVEVSAILPSEKSCTIYEEVSKGGRILLPCDGADGQASASFGEHEYEGEVARRQLVLTHSYEFEEQDGCRWRINGRIAGDPTSGTVRWTYAEEILEDDKKNCWATCTARSSMRLRAVR